MTAPPLATPGTSSPQAALEQTLEQLLQSLLEMGICASDVQEAALETSAGGAPSGYPGGLVGKKAAQTVEHLARLHSLKDTVGHVYIPLDVINCVDAGKNPHTYTRDFIERVAGENMYTNGILSAVTDYRDILNDQLTEAFPDLAELIPKEEKAENGVEHGLNGLGEMGETAAQGGEERVKMEE